MEQNDPAAPSKRRQRAPRVLYRAVGPNEAADIVATGTLRPATGSLSGKWFAVTLADAVEWGWRMKWQWDQNPFDVVEIPVSACILRRMFYQARLDGIGPAYYADGELLAELIPRPPLPALPIRRR